MAEYIKKMQNGAAVKSTTSAPEQTTTQPTTQNFQVGNSNINLKEYENSLMKNFQSFRDWYSQGRSKKDLQQLDTDYANYMTDLQKGNILGLGLDNKFQILDPGKSTLNLNRPDLGALGFFASKVAHTQLNGAVNKKPVTKKFTNTTLASDFSNNFFGGSESPDLQAWFDLDPINKKTNTRSTAVRMSKLADYLDSYDLSKYSDTDESLGGINSVKTKLSRLKTALRDGVLNNEDYAAAQALGFNLRPWLNDSTSLKFDTQGNLLGQEEPSVQETPVTQKTNEKPVTNTVNSRNTLSSTDKGMMGIQDPVDYENMYKRASAFYNKWKQTNAPEWSLKLNKSYQSVHGKDVNVFKHLVLQGYTKEKAVSFINNNLNKIGLYLKTQGIPHYTYNIVGDYDGSGNINAHTYFQRYLKELSTHPGDYNASGFMLNGQTAYSIPNSYDKETGTIYAYLPHSNTIKRVQIIKHQELKRSTWDRFYPGLNNYIDSKAQSYAEQQALESQAATNDQENSEDSGIPSAQYGAKLGAPTSSYNDIYNQLSPTVKNKVYNTQINSNNHTKEAQQHAVYKVNFDTADIAHLTSLFADITSLFGGAVGAGAGAVSVGSDIVGDIAEGQSAGDVALNALKNTGWAVAGVVPGLKTMKVAKTALKWAPRVGMLMASYGLLNDPSMKATYTKVFKNGDFSNMNHQDLKNIVTLGRVITGGVNMASATVRANRWNKATTKEVTSQKVITKEGKEAFLKNEDVEKINKVGRSEGQEAANKLFIEKAKDAEGNNLNETDGIASGTFEPRTGLKRFNITKKQLNTTPVKTNTGEYARFLQEKHDQMLANSNHPKLRSLFSNYELEQQDPHLATTGFGKFAANAVQGTWLNNIGNKLQGTSIGFNSPYSKKEFNAWKAKQTPTEEPIAESVKEPVAEPVAESVKSSSIFDEVTGDSPEFKAGDSLGTNPISENQAQKLNNIVNNIFSDNKLKQIVRGNKDKSKDLESLSTKSIKDKYNYLKTFFDSGIKINAKHTELTNKINNLQNILNEIKGIGTVKKQTGGKLSLILQYHKQGGLIKYQNGGQSSVKFRTTNDPNSWRHSVFNNYKQYILDSLKGADKNNFAEWLNNMQHNHSIIYHNAGGPNNKWQNSAVFNNLVKQYQTDYANEIKGGIAGGFNTRGIKPAQATNRYDQSGKVRTSKDWYDEAKKENYSPDGLYGAITDDRRLLGREGDWDDPKELEEFRNSLKAKGYDMYLDTDKYYKIKPIEPAAPKAKGSINAGGVNPAKEPVNIDIPKSDLLGLGRLVGDIQSTNDRTREYIKHLRPTLVEPYNIYRQIYGDYGTQAALENQGKQYVTLAKQNKSSDANVNNAALLAAQAQSEESAIKGKLNNNEHIATTEAASEKATDANKEQNNIAANTNNKSMIDNEKEIAGLNATRQAANQQSIDTYLSQLEKDAKTKENEKHEMQDYIDYQSLGSPTYDFSTDPEYSNYLKRYTAATTDEERNSIQKELIDYKAKQAIKTKNDYYTRLAKLKGLRYQAPQVEYTPTYFPSSKKGGVLNWKNGSKNPFDISNSVVVNARIKDNDRLVKSIVEIIKQKEQTYRGMKQIPFKIIKLS